MVIVTTDHGTYNGDHGQVGKLQTHMYQGISHIPMVIWHPKLGHGKRIKQLVQPIDIFATVLDAVGLDAPEGVHGRSLIPLLANGQSEDWRASALFGRCHLECNLTDGEYVLYNRLRANEKPSGQGGDTRRQCETKLIHLGSDAGEENDLSLSCPDQLSRMQRMLVEKLKEIEAPREMFVQYGLY